MRKEGYKGKIILCCVLLFILLSLIGLYLYLVNAYQVQTVYVEGNIHYTEEEIKEMIMGG